MTATAIAGWGPNPDTGLTFGGGETRSTTVSVGGDCEPPEESAPEVGAINECAVGGITVELINTDGTAAAVFTVNGTPVAVPAGQTVVHPVAAAEDSTFTLTITADGMDPFSQEITRNCDMPEPSVGAIDTCAAGGITVSSSTVATTTRCSPCRASMCRLQPIRRSPIRWRPLRTAPSP